MSEIFLLLWFSRSGMSIKMFKYFEMNLTFFVSVLVIVRVVAVFAVDVFGGGHLFLVCLDIFINIKLPVKFEYIISFLPQIN